MTAPVCPISVGICIRSASPALRSVTVWHAPALLGHSPLILPLHAVVEFSTMSILRLDVSTYIYNSLSPGLPHLLF